MSFEGVRQWLTTKGRYYITDAYEEEPTVEEDDRLFWTHLVDQTNGYEESDIGTQHLTPIVIGFEDHWKIDHYGNHYAVKVKLFGPDPKDIVEGGWTRVNDIGTDATSSSETDSGTREEFPEPDLRTGGEPTETSGEA